MKNSIIQHIGNTPLVSLKLDTLCNANVFAKLELQNPFGMKDRVAKSILLNAIQNGSLKKGDPIIESSSGTLAMGVALVGRYLGFDVHIVTDPRIDSLTYAKLKALNVHIHVVQEMAKSGGWQQARLDYLAEFRKSHPTAFWPQQYENPYNPLAYVELAEEVMHKIDHIDYLVGSVGSGGSLCGTARALKAVNPFLKVIAVDAIGSSIFCETDNPYRLQSGLGNSIQPANVDQSLIDEIHWLNDEEAFNWTRELAFAEQIFAGNSSGSVYAVSHWLSQQAKKNENILCIFPDRGDRYLNTIYSDEFYTMNHLSNNSLNLEPLLIQKNMPYDTWSFTRLQKGASSLEKNYSIY